MAKRTSPAAEGPGATRSGNVLGEVRERVTRARDWFSQHDVREVLTELAGDRYAKNFA